MTMRLARSRHCTHDLRTWLAGSLLLGLLCLPLGACKQGQGERCQVDDDCEEGYLCCVREVDRALGGTCQPENACELTPVTDGGIDMGELDLGKADRGVDSKPTADQGRDDLALDGEVAGDAAATDDAKAADAEPLDAEAPDSAPPAADGLADDAAADQ